MFNETLDDAISAVAKAEATLGADEANLGSIQATITQAQAPLAAAQAAVATDTTNFNAALDSLIAAATAAKIPTP